MEHMMRAFLNYLTPCGIATQLPPQTMNFQCELSGLLGHLHKRLTFSRLSVAQ
jgi:hypothetical protein